ncbi:MAG: TMEM165/GDT1 family protein [Methanothrix sp.]|nr:TMEM165/GDT1 family protein [Methanothrix sp.]
MVFSWVMDSLTIISIMAIYLGKFISRRIDRRIVIRIAGALFILIGMTFMLSALNSSAFADII